MPHPALGSAGGTPPGPAGSEVISSLDASAALEDISMEDVGSDEEELEVLDELLVDEVELVGWVLVTGLVVVTGLTDGVTGGLTADEVG